MHNLKDSFFLAAITTYQGCFIWDNDLEQFIAILALTIIWWCILTWVEEVFEKWERRRTNDVSD